MLNQVPGLGDSLMSLRVVVLHAKPHVLGDLHLEVALEDEGSDSGANLGDEDNGKEEGVGLEHAIILAPGAAAPEESDEEDHQSNNNDEDGGIDIAGPNKVEIVLSLDLDIGAETYEGQASHGEHKVEEEKDVLDEALAAGVHLG